jgi:hypothetical protein
VPGIDGVLLLVVWALASSSSRATWPSVGPIPQAPGGAATPSSP